MADERIVAVRFQCLTDDGQRVWDSGWISPRRWKVIDALEAQAKLARNAGLRVIHGTRLVQEVHREM